MSSLSPLAAYRLAVEQGFQSDPAQWHAVQILEHCQQAIHAGGGASPGSGVYLWGPVGRGKTWLMDRFHESLQVPARRQHFHHFMRWVHQRLFQLIGTADPLQALATELGREVRVLCFDELFVTDIGDAIILGRLFEVMFEQGVVLVATSNQPPEQLYADGFNRQRFLPAIAAINRCMQVVNLDGGEDHRLHPGAGLQRYWLAQAGQPGALEAVFRQLAGDDAGSREPVILAHRPIAVVRRSARVLWSRFDDLCKGPLAAYDFIVLCDQFDAVLLSGVPNMSARQGEGKIARGTEDAAEQVAAGDRELPRLSKHDDGARRFIALVDECYDRQVPLYIEAEVAMDALYTEGYLAFPFRRTLSRLKEMQLQRFGRTAAPAPG